MNPGIAGVFGSLFAVQLAYIFFAKFVPVNAELNNLSVDELRAKYKKFDRTLSFAYLVTVPIITYLVWILLLWSAEFYTKFLPTAQITYHISFWAYWFLPALILSIVLWGNFFLYGCKCLLKESYAEFVVYQSLLYKNNYLRVTKIVSIFGVLLGGLGIVLGMDDYVQLTQDELIVNDYFSLEANHHKISDIVKIETAPELLASKQLEQQREYVFTFKNGERWTTYTPPFYGVSEQDKQNFVDIILHRTNVPVTELQYFKAQDLP